ncbi:MAG: restriction endonuclease subunit S, partial [Treponema sp.]|nr:restriction endonuclease subunit S [Treponema sp.]
NGSILNKLTQTNMNNIYITLPKIIEQRKIADFLDKKCQEIDSVLEKTRESIEEYKKLKNAVITQAVTKGIRPNRKMKDSGIEWIGEIPEEWGIKKLRYIADSFDKGYGITKEEVFIDGNTPCIRYGEIYSKYNNSFKQCISKTKKEKLSVLKYIEKGDILFVGTGELIEEIGKNIVYLGEESCLAGGDIIILKHSQDPKFLNYALNSYYSQIQKSCGKTKLKVVHISSSELKNIILFLPSLTEQSEIADYLDKKCSQINNLINKKEQLITELETYKKSLIYEYVTGKKEVL